MRLDTVGMVVADMARSLAFYRTLGLAIPADEDGSPHVEVTATSGYSIGFAAEDMVRRIDPQWRDGAGERISLQFRYDAPAEVDAAFARLIAAGHRPYRAPWDAPWGQRFARVYDPDGNVVSLFCPLDAVG